MDSRYKRSSSPSSRRHNQPFRSSTGTLIYPSNYDPYPARSSRDSVLTGPRSSLETFGSRAAPRTTRTELPPPPTRRAHDDHLVAPRRMTLDPGNARRPLGVVSTSSPNRHYPVVLSSAEKVSSPVSKSGLRDPESYHLQPASSGGHHRRNFSADGRNASTYLGSARDRLDRPSNAPPSVIGATRTYVIKEPPLVRPREENDGRYRVETRQPEPLYRDIEPRARPRRESLTGGRRERPLSMVALDEHLPKGTSYRDYGPPVTTRGLEKLDRSTSLRSAHRPKDDASSIASRDYASRSSRDDVEGIRKHRPRDAREKEDGYSSYREDRDHRSHRHKREESHDRDRPDRLAPFDSDARRPVEDRHRKHREPHIRPRERDDVEEKEHRHRDRKHDDDTGHTGEKLAFGAAGAAAAAGLVAEGVKKHRNRDRDDRSPTKIDERRPRTRDEPDRSRHSSETSYDSDDSDEEERKRERRRRRRQEREDNRPVERDSREEADQHARNVVANAPYDRRGPVPDNNDEKEERRARRHQRKERRDRGDEISNEEEDETESEKPSDQPEPSRPRVRVVSPAREGEQEVRPRGILRRPKDKFPEEANPIREGVAPLNMAKGENKIPENARWTKLSRTIVNPEALEQGNERYELVGLTHVIVLRVLSQEEIAGYAQRTHEIRMEREEKLRELRALEDEERRHKRETLRLDERAYDHDSSPERLAIEPPREPPREHPAYLQPNNDRPQHQEQQFVVPPEQRLQNPYQQQQPMAPNFAAPKQAQMFPAPPMVQQQQPYPTNMQYVPQDAAFRENPTMPGTYQGYVRNPPASQQQQPAL
ncbi:hypothetical protein MMC25_001287 [Agyrium rufum]|nr:hypothetical protein [Agyrium rufum]